MQIDRYTKVTLTVIATALSIIALHSIVPPARAQTTSDCGDTYIDACYVQWQNPMPVRSEN